MTIDPSLYPLLVGVAAFRFGPPLLMATLAARTVKNKLGAIAVFIGLWIALDFLWGSMLQFNLKIGV